jgi:hypothetical protein
VALLSSGLFEIWFSYQERKASLISIQREQAEAAAAKIGQFVKGDRKPDRLDRAVIMVGGHASSSGASTRCACCAGSGDHQALPSSIPRAASSSRCRGSPWT